MLQQLGYSAADKLLIINADDFGLTQGTNESIIRLFVSGRLSSASLMMPCLSSVDAINRSIAAGVKQFGIHLTLTSDNYQNYSPVYQERPLSSITRSDGTFHIDCAQFERQADVEEVRIELETQIQQAYASGVDVTHLDNHAGSLFGLHTGRDFLEIAFDLSIKYQLPFNLPRRIVEQPYFNNDQLQLFQTRLVSARERGIVLIDDMIALPYSFQPMPEYAIMKAKLMELLHSLQPGITQLTVHPSLVTDSLRALTDCYSEREIEHQLLQDDEIMQILRLEEIHLLSWKEVRDLQRRL
ncbi:carbohydrate deacetylase [Paenibacillus sp. CCS19]|uniref:polysaccharide deacetylase family protein n=1 Tax=Paenibacillus sp. CCS19 TaxID=3158387 RepID=UPI00256DF5D5|nr:polysaccharide deacetylase family protein [Paenibacillus cellulosilyticus]GMK37282.1 carbohydrate deacetylase [Paenibacillus cellulosilyticus]